MSLKSRERRKQGLRSELGKKAMVELVNRLLGRLKVPLRAFCWSVEGVKWL